MPDQDEKLTKETSRKEKLKADEAKLSDKEQARTRVYLAREQEIEKAQKTRENQRAENRVQEDLEELAKEKTRKEAYLAREKKIAEDQEARRLKSGQSSRK